MRWLLAAVKLGDAGHRAGRNRVIAAEDERNLRRLQRLDDQLGFLRAGRR